MEKLDKEYMVPFYPTFATFYEFIIFSKLKVRKKKKKSNNQGLSMKSWVKVFVRKPNLFSIETRGCSQSLGHTSSVYLQHLPGKYDFIHKGSPGQLAGFIFLWFDNRSQDQCLQERTKTWNQAT